MSNPYKVGAIAPSVTGLPAGSVTLTQQEYADFKQAIPAKVYEPMMIGGELVISTSGDCLVEWGGNYAA